MPSIVHKLVIIAAVDGLLLQPLAVRNQYSIPTIQITYKTNKIVVLNDSLSEAGRNSSSLEAHGVVGRFLGSKMRSILY